MPKKKIKLKNNVENNDKNVATNMCVLTIENLQLRVNIN